MQQLKKLKFFFLIFIINFIFPNRASAYIDPGSGSYLFQMLIATALGLGYSIKLYWTKIVSVIKNLFGSKKD